MRISQKLLKQIEHHGEAEFPKEACGLLIGTPEIIVDAIPSQNLAASDSEFLINPALQLRMQRELRDTGKKVIGVYHSHPSGNPTPSQQDMQQIGESGFLWLITAIKDGYAICSRLFRTGLNENSHLHQNFIEQRLQSIDKVA